MAAIYSVVAYLAGSLLVFAGLGTLCVQGFLYLKDGYWTPYSLLFVATKLSDSPWLQTPDDWVGLHNMLAATPLSVAAIMIGLMVRVTSDISD